MLCVRQHAVQVPHGTFAEPLPLIAARVSASQGEKFPAASFLGTDPSASLRQA